MAAPFEIHEPSKEEMQARAAEWNNKLLGKYVAEEPHDKQVRERFPNLNLQAVPEDAESVSKDDEWHFKAGEVDLVKTSKIKDYTIRHLWPGRPATRDLNWGRMNLYTDNNGKIENVSFG